MRARLDKAGYVGVKTPQLIDRDLWERSGHWEKFREHMFIAEVDESASGDVHDHHVEHHDGTGGDFKEMLALKPMNCPGHVQIFRQGIKSYRDLPLRMAEFGSCHRYEPSGALHGLMRVRAFTQDDAHIFCTEDQINSEAKTFCDLLIEDLPRLRLRGCADQVRRPAAGARRRRRHLGPGGRRRWATRSRRPACPTK